MRRAFGLRETPSRCVVLRCAKSSNLVTIVVFSDLLFVTILRAPTPRRIHCGGGVVASIDSMLPMRPCSLGNYVPMRNA